MLTAITLCDIMSLYQNIALTAMFGYSGNWANREGVGEIYGSMIVAAPVTEPPVYI